MVVPYSVRASRHPHDLDEEGHDVRAAGVFDYLLGEDSLFETTIGAWVNSGGTLTWSNNGNYFIEGGSGSLQFVSTATAQYVEIPIAGTFLAGHTYDAFVWAAYEENAFAGTESLTVLLGLHGTDDAQMSIAVLADQFYVDDNGVYVPLYVRWIPSADRTGVTLRVLRTAVTGVPTVTLHLGHARAGEVSGVGSLGLQVVGNPYQGGQVMLNAEFLKVGAWASILSVAPTGVTFSDPLNKMRLTFTRSRMTVVSSGSLAGGVVGPNRASAPSSPVEGETYYDTTSHKARTFDGTVWRDHW